MTFDPEKALRLVREAPVIAFDTETSGVDWRRNATVSYVITVDRDNNTYTPIRCGGGGNIDGGVPLQSATCDVMPQHPWEKELAKAFDERNRRGFLTIGHSIKFDAHFSANHGVLLGRNLEDTQLNEAIIDEYAGSYSLDACCKRHKVSAKLGDELYQHLANKFGGVADRKQMQHFWRLAGDDELAVEYALQDGVSTLELRAAQLPHIMEEYEPKFSLEKVWRLENDLIWTTWRLERRGIKIDEEQLQRVKQQLAAMEDEARAALPAGFNVRSTTQVQRWFESQGVTEFNRTEPTTRFPDGQVSIRQAWLEAHPLGKPIVTLRQIQDLSSKFINPLEERHLFKGRVHASYEQMRGDSFGTISGRYSSHSPNNQQIPSRNVVLSKLLRSIYIADDGMEFFEADYSQAEPRTFSHFMNCALLLEGYARNPPIDIHTNMSVKLGIERNLAKRVVMSCLTGQSLDGFCRHLGYSKEEGAPLYNGFHSELPELMTFHKKARAAYKQRGYVKTILGRQFRLDDPQFAYRAVSRVIQGNDSDVLKWKLLEADKWCEENGDIVNILATIHDSIAGQSPKEDRSGVNLMLDRFSSVQEPPFNFKIPFKCDVGFGKNWAEAKHHD